MADGAADDVRLRERRVEAARRRRTLRCSPNVMPNTPPLPGTSSMTCGIGVGDVLAEHADALVGRHLLVQRQADRLAERDRLAGVVVGGSARIRLAARADPGRARGRARDAGRAGATRARLRPRRAPSPWRRRASARVELGESATPAAMSCCSSSVIGSCSRSSSSSSGPRYFFWSSESECEYGRVTSACTRHGPAPARTCAIAFGALAPHLEVVAAVHLHDVQPADAAHHLRDRRRVLVGRPHGDRVAVVGDDEQHRQVQAGTRC